MDEAAHNAIADVQAGRQVVCTMEEYYTTVRMALQRYAMEQAAQSHPDVAARVTAELKRLDTSPSQGWWPGTYRSLWERLFVWVGRRRAMRRLWRYYYLRAHGFTTPSQQTITLPRQLRVPDVPPDDGDRQQPSQMPAKSDQVPSQPCVR